MNEIDIIDWMRNRWIVSIKVNYKGGGITDFTAIDEKGEVQHFTYNPNLQKTTGEKCLS